MRKTALLVIAGALCLGLTGVSLAEVTTGCLTNWFDYESDAGFATAEQAVEAADIAAPATLDEGTTELGGDTVVNVSGDEDGFVLDSYVVCETDTILALGAAFAHDTGDHNPATYFNNDNDHAGLEVWPGGNPSIVGHFAANKGDNARTAARRGFDRWEDGTATVNYSVGAEVGASQVDWNNCNTWDNEIRWNQEVGLNGSVARGGACWNGQGELYTFAIAFDDDPSWHTGTGAPGAGEHDVEGFAAHEFGHVIGWDDHWSGGGCNNPDRPTMCGTAAPGGDNQRTLEPDDIHTAEAAYD
jgi:hypothetical protein